jgi:sulfur-oxidizing protein SoxZ
MMASGIRLRAKEQDGIVEVKALLEHPMDTGSQRDSAGNPIPAHYITEIKIEHNGKTILSGQWGPGVSKNPYLSFKFKGGAQGDTIKLSWIDNQGQGAAEEVTIK